MTIHRDVLSGFHALPRAAARRAVTNSRTKKGDGSGIAVTVAQSAVAMNESAVQTAQPRIPIARNTIEPPTSNPPDRDCRDDCS
jgi:hypothetical protein